MPLSVQYIARETRVRWFGATNKPTPSGRISGTEEQLALRLKRKDKDSFVELYDLYGRTVYRYLMHMTGSISQAEELTQEVFVVILDAMATPEPLRSFDLQKGTLEGYLLGIARNLARQEHRRTLKLLFLDDLSENVEWSLLLTKENLNAGSWDLHSILTTHDELKLLHAFILELPEHYRTAVVLCGLQEKSYRDAARILDCSEGTVASRLNRAKSLLAAKLKAAPKKECTQGEKNTRKGAPHVRTSPASH
jgi:RNA polymerase sigma-70 factor, ECF subfamily